MALTRAPNTHLIFFLFSLLDLRLLALLALVFLAFLVLLVLLVLLPPPPRVAFMVACILRCRVSCLFVVGTYRRAFFFLYIYKIKKLL